MSKALRNTRNIEPYRSSTLVRYLRTRHEGNSLVRILCAHDESWWVNDLMNQHVDEDIKSPIQFSENQSSFRCYWPDLKMGFLTTHNYLEIDEKNEILLDIMKKKRKISR